MAFFSSIIKFFKRTDLRLSHFHVEACWIHWRLSMILKQVVHEVIFFDMWNYVYFESVFNTLYIKIRKNKHVKKILSFNQVGFKSRLIPVFKHLQSFSQYFETSWCFTKFSFHRKWNDARLLLINMVYEIRLTICRTTSTVQFLSQNGSFLNTSKKVLKFTLLGKSLSDLFTEVKNWH